MLLFTNKIKRPAVILVFILSVIYSCDFKSSEKTLNQINKDLISVTDSISQLMSAYHYNPAELKTDEYLELEKKIQVLAKTVQTKQEFIDGFNQVWNDGPFSHVRLGFLERRAETMANYIDSLRVGSEAVSLKWVDKTAVLTVNTMTGVDTKEQIFEAYREIALHETESLIIDLRNNTGGTFAGVPLVSHLLTDSIDAGWFVSRKWWTKHSKSPSFADIQDLPPWYGWSIKSFWHDVQEQALTRVKFTPMNPHFGRPTYVLISNKTASAAEFSADALASQENVTLIGETTAGEMLSQKMYDLPHGFQLSLPIAEYYSHRIGKIEGNGVVPDIEINQSIAMDIALSIIKGENIEDALSKAQQVINEMKEEPLGDEAIYLLGSMNEWGKNQDATPQFKYTGNGNYEATATLKEGEYEFKIAPIDWSFDFGANSNQESMSIGKKSIITKVPKSNNLMLSIDKEAKFVFRLNVTNENATTLYIFKN